MLQLYATSSFHNPMGFEQLSLHKSRVPDELDTDFPSALRIAAKILDHLPVLPIHSGNVAAIGAAVFPSQFFEFPDKLMAH